MWFASRSERVDFDRAAGEIRGDGRRGAWTVPWPEGDTPLDPLLAELRVRRLACSETPPEQLRSLIARRGALVAYAATRLGEETLGTPLGRLRTLRYELARADGSSRRRSRWWYAPSAGCALVRFEHQDGDGRVRRMDLVRLSRR